MAKSQKAVISHRKWDHVMDLIHRCEDKYGGIKDTPDDDPNMKEIIDICAINRGCTSVKITPERQALIAKRIDQGYTRAYVMRHYHVTTDNLTQIMAAYKVKVKPQYVYILSKVGQPTYFLKAKSKDLPVVFKRRFSNGYAANEYLKTNGWTIKTKNTIWKNVPVGCYYISEDHSRVIFKTSEKYEG